MRALLGEQHFRAEAPELSPNYDQHILGLEAKHHPREEQTPEIDLVKEPQDWINGFDAGFNNRPFVSGNTQQYCDGYVHGQHTWYNPTVYPSFTSVATEASILKSLNAGVIDPKLLDLDASDDDLFRTPPKLTAVTRSIDGQSNIGNLECTEPPSTSLSDPSRSTPQAPGSLAPQFSHAMSDDGHETARVPTHLLGTDSSGLDSPVLTTARNIHETSITRQLRTPINSRKISGARSTPIRRMIRSPLLVHDVEGNIMPMSLYVRRGLSMANDARAAAEVFISQGEHDAAAAAVENATQWEKKARRRQTKNESQNRIRAQKRLGKRLGSTIAIETTKQQEAIANDRGSCNVSGCLNGLFCMIHQMNT